MAVLKPIYLVPGLGEYAVLPDGAVINIGGVVGPNFTVDGKPLLFADGTATDGSTVSVLDLQTAYENSFEALINFTASKDFVLKAVNGKEWRFDADTGDVTIGGNLTILGSAATTINAAINSDRITLRPTAGTYVPFSIEPLGGVVPAVNLVDIKASQGGQSVFTVGPTGATYIQNLTVGQLSGVYLVTQAEVQALQTGLAAATAALGAHTNLTDTAIKHTAEQVSVDTSALSVVTGDTVQEAIESIASTLTSVTMGQVRGYEHVQETPADTWTIEHAQNTKRIQVTVWDAADELLFADNIKLTDVNTVVVSFNTPITGRAVLMLF